MSSPFSRAKTKRVHSTGALFLIQPLNVNSFCFSRPHHWWAHLGSNQGPTGYEPVALPAELWAPSISYYSLSIRGVNASRLSESFKFGVRSFEPPSSISKPIQTPCLSPATPCTPCAAGLRSSPLRPLRRYLMSA